MKRLKRLAKLVLGIALIALGVIELVPFLSGILYVGTALALTAILAGVIMILSR
jgi:hypothetical protein